MKHLGTMGVIREVGSDVYCSTGFSKAMTIEIYSDGFPCMYVEYTLLVRFVRPGIF